MNNIVDNNLESAERNNLWLVVILSILRYYFNQNSIKYWNILFHSDHIVHWHFILNRLFVQIKCCFFSRNNDWHFITILNKSDFSAHIIYFSILHKILLLPKIDSTTIYGTRKLVNNCDRLYYINFIIYLFVQLQMTTMN